MRALLFCVLVLVASCQCGFDPVAECARGGCDDAGADAGVDAGADAGVDAGMPVCNGGDSNNPHLCLAPAQPAFCPREWPLPDNGLACPTPGTCWYVYPAGTHPAGCDAMCTTRPNAPRQADGGLMWNVNPCI
jgi:hypothetical protein